MPVRDHNPTELQKTAITISFLCANLGRGDPAKDIILQSAWDSGTDVLLIQEPWTQHKDGHWLTKSHPGFDRHLPPRVAANSSRPRSLNYTRKGIKCQQQAVCETSPDLTAVTVEGVTFVSIYRATGADLLPLLSWALSGPTVIGGNFNAAHHDWQPMATGLHGDGQVLTK